MYGELESLLENLKLLLWPLPTSDSLTSGCSAAPKTAEPKT